MLLNKYIKKLIFLFVDIIYFFCNKLLFKKITKLDEIYILLLKPLGIGDLIMLSPFVNAIEKHFKEQEIFLVTTHDLFIDFEKVKTISPYKMRSRNLKNALMISPTLAMRHSAFMFKGTYFVGYFVSNRLVSNITNISLRYDAIGTHYFVRTIPILKALGVDFNYEDVVYPDLRSQKPGILLPPNYICISPFSLWKARQFPIESYIEIIQKLPMTFNLVLIGSPNQEEMIFNSKIEAMAKRKVYNFCGKTTLFESIWIIKHASLFIGNDAGPSHIAHITNCKPIAIFGSVCPEHRLPLGNTYKKNIVDIDARTSCPFYACYDGYNKPSCLNENKYICLRKIAVNNVLEKIYGLLEWQDALRQYQ